MILVLRNGDTKVDDLACVSSAWCNYHITVTNFKSFVAFCLDRVIPDISFLHVQIFGGR
jgi:hypothetical protein